MAVMIIGAAKAAEAESSPLPIPSVELPRAGAAPKAQRILDDHKIRELLRHPNPIVRAFAIEQVSHLGSERWSEELIGAITDTDEIVAMEAIRTLQVDKHRPAVGAILERFQTASGALAATAASALGELAPEQLLDAVRKRGRLDDEAYAATATALACIGSEEVIDFLDRALNRAGALAPERRGALYSAALLSGNAELSSRVIGLALADSKEAEPEDGSFPTRAALSALAGVPIQFSRKQSGLELYDHVREVLEADVMPHLPESDRAQMEEALKAKKISSALGALSAVLQHHEDGAIHEEGSGSAGSGSVSKSASTVLSSMPRRRRGLLQALIAKRDTIDGIDLPGSVVFLATAAQASTVILAHEQNDSNSPALIALAKALESSADAKALASMSEAELTALFAERTERQMRRILNIVTHEAFRRAETVHRMFAAILRAGHGSALLEAVADVTDESIHRGLLLAFAKSPEIAESILVEVFERETIDPKIGSIALTAVEAVRTEQLALAVGRRFLEFRTLARRAATDAVLRMADPRLIPLVESRAYPGEHEELAWVALSLVHDRPVEGKLKEVIDRIEGRAEPHPSMRGDVQVLLACKRCKETLAYGFERVFLDLEAKDQWGDPAFAGEVVCKACGTEDQLEPTPEAARVLTGHMLEYLAAAKQGLSGFTPKVTPLQTTVHGRKMGLAAALRALDQEIQGSPDSIRLRLQRGRLRLMLKRRYAADDIDRALEIDPGSPEAMALKAALHVRAEDPSRAAEVVAEAIRLLDVDPPARLYDVHDPELFRESLEDYLLELESIDAKIPRDIHLDEARRRRALEARSRENSGADLGGARTAPTDGGASTERGGDLGDALRRANRNDPCPCGSGKKFKKCHGKSS